jgi:hypothetical protein
VKSGKLIDLKQSTLNALKTEEMLAYTMFNAVVEGGPPLEGFCKISKPKIVGKLKYFSIFYIIDTPDENSRNAATLLTSKIDWKRLKQMLPEVESEMGIPHQNIAEYLFMEREIFMNNPECLSKDYIFRTLYPTLEKLTGFRGNDLLFWDTETEPKASPSLDIQGNRSLLDRLKAFLAF